MGTSKQRNKEGEREAIVEGEKSSDDDDGDDDDDNDKMDDNNKTDNKIPNPFQSYTNLEICNWLVEHPNILQLANQMLEMNESSFDTSAVTLPSSTSSSSKITDVSIKSV